MAGQAQTGTGKTAAFLVASFSRLLELPKPKIQRPVCPRMLVVAPTRELAIQIREEADLLGRFTGLSMHAVYGGVDYEKQRDRFNKPVDVLIGTPGRLIDYFKQRVFTLKDTEIVIIDEADRMFDMGFIDDIRYLLRKMSKPSQRQSFLWSATLSQRVMELAFEHLGEVERIAVDAENITAANIDARVYHVGQEDKFPLLLGILKREAPTRCLIFVNMRIEAARVSERLEGEGYQVGKLAGDMDQKKRLKLLSGFKEGRIGIMVATDVASRGLHIDDVSHVINYDLPQDPEDYVHRIGRTARAGASGKALSLACEKYVYSLEAIEEFIGGRIPFEFASDDMLVKPRTSRYRRRSRPPERGRGRNRASAS